MSKINGGSFWVGTAGSKGPEDEHPTFQANVGDFCLDRTEVTAEAYDACVERKGCAARDPARSNLTCNLGRDERKRHPANCVSWREANAYCAGLGKRLPSEVEWEYAARGGAEYRAFSFGAGSPDERVCWKSAMSCEVGSYPAGAFGLFDMAGNVWEWTATRYGPYPFGEIDNPNRVYRGGSWSRRFDKWLSPTLRNRFDETKWGSHLGFRCAADVPDAARCGSAIPGPCPLEVTDAECPPETKWNGVRCTRPGAPLCRPGAHPVPGLGCQRDVPIAASTATEPTGEAVVFVRSPEFDADCREFQPQRPEAYRLSQASHPERTQAGASRGCKNRDVGVGWNSACCPLR
jgi:Sulfatase-modifying factor enzyme 1